MNRLNTGDTGQAVAASSDGLLYSGFMGDGYYVLSSGSKFDAEVQSNNSIRIADGSALMQGRHVEIPASDSEYVTINNGSQGMNRKDLIVFRYTKAVTGAEEVNVVVIEGEETSGTAEVPEYTEGDILSGATQADMPLYIVELQGINIVSVTPQFTIVNTHKDVMDKIGNTAMGTTATTLTGAVSELNRSLNQKINTSVIKTGITYCTIEDDSTVYKDFSVSFSSAFSSVPRVFLTQYHGGNLKKYATCQCCVLENSITKNGFTIRIIRNTSVDNSYIYPLVQWLAIAI